MILERGNFNHLDDASNFYHEYHPYSSLNLDEDEAAFESNFQTRGRRYVGIAPRVIQVASYESTIPSPASRELYSYKKCNKTLVVFFSGESYPGWDVHQEPRSLIVGYLSKSVENRNELVSYLEKIYLLEKEGRSRAASKVIFEFIEIQFEHSNLDLLNSFLKSIILENLSQWSISGLVRFTARARKHLVSWHDVLATAKEVLKVRGLDANKLLTGITE